MKVFFFKFIYLLLHIYSHVQASLRTRISFFEGFVHTNNHIKTQLNTGDYWYQETNICHLNSVLRRNLKSVNKLQSFRCCCWGVRIFSDHFTQLWWDRWSIEGYKVLGMQIAPLTGYKKNDRNSLSIDLYIKLLQRDVSIWMIMSSCLKNAKCFDGWEDYFL